MKKEFLSPKSASDKKSKIKLKDWTKPSYSELNIASGTTANDSTGDSDAGPLYSSRS